MLFQKYFKEGSTWRSLYVQSKLGLVSKSCSTKLWSGAESQLLMNTWLKDDQCASILHQADRPERQCEVYFWKQICPTNQVYKICKCHCFFCSLLDTYLCSEKCPRSVPEVCGTTPEKFCIHSAQFRKISGQKPLHIIKIRRKNICMYIYTPTGQNPYRILSRLGPYAGIISF